MSDITSPKELGVARGGGGEGTYPSNCGTETVALTGPSHWKRVPATLP